MLPRSSFALRRTVAALSLVALGALVFPLAASAAYQSVSLYNKEKFKGYTTSIFASKPATGNATLGISLYKAGQSHSYRFDIARSSISLNKSLTAGSIKFNAVAAKGVTGVAAAALGKYGSGAISFVSAGKLTSVSCTNGGKQTTRAISRKSGSLTFSPSKTTRDKYSRSKWTGTALTVNNGDGWCQRGPSTPPKCTKYVSLSSGSPFVADGLYTYLSVQRNAGAAKTDVWFSYQPAKASIAPATGVTHGRTAKIDNTRFTVSGLDSASVNLNGVPGFSGTFSFTREFPVSNIGGTCPYQSAVGAPAGGIKVTFDFANDPTHTGHDYATLQKA